MRYLKYLCALLLIASPVFMACSSSDDDPTSSSFPISSFSDDMKQCAPDLSSSTVMDSWTTNAGADGWSAFATYGVFKKHFNPDSGLESLYAVVDQLDEIATHLGAVPEGTGSTTMSGYTVDYEDFSGTVTLPTIFGSSTVADFTKKVEITGTGVTDIMYYKTEGTDSTEKILFYYSNTTDNETGIVYATRNTSTDDIVVNVACHKSPSLFSSLTTTHVDADFRVYLYFTGNVTAHNFKFKLKTDAAQGWSFFGGGSVASDSSVIAVRGSDEADTATYANDGGNLADNNSSSYYVILTFANMKDSTFDPSGTYPKAGTTANLGSESSGAEFITIDDASCLYATPTEWRNFKYPQDATELDISESK